MKVLAIYLLIFGLTVPPVMAGKNQAKDDKKVATTEPGGAPNAAAAASSSEPDLRQLQDLLLDQQKRIQALEAEMYELSGHTFNVGSPQQLQRLLYDDLGLGFFLRGPELAEPNAQTASRARAAADIVLAKWRQ